VADETPQLPNNRPAQPFRIKDHLAKLVVGVLVLVIGGALVTWLGLSGGGGSNRESPTPAATSTAAEPTGQIVSPASGDSVGRDIEARGVLADIPEDQHVWLAVRDGNLLYPQDSEVTPPDGQWSLRFHQGGVTKSISLELYRMGDQGNLLIKDRFKAGDFSGMSGIPGAERLDAVENLRIRD
jgi:hypothetical protein